MDSKKQKIQELTKAELEIMQIIWKLGKEFIVRDVHDMMPEPKPAYNTVSTMVRILDSKGFLTHKTYGHTNIYKSAVTKDDYTGRFMQGVLNSFFEGSVSRLVTFFSDNKNISVQEADEILNMLSKK
ncbi:MAG: BlaI/MecI/CopY family transcriptional regulator [Bacteroidaceae bacterium]|nr:BlaI/MecI/CopY family transcriptional regulator [Bacteroidaceae bacterium]